MTRVFGGVFVVRGCLSRVYKMNVHLFLLYQDFKRFHTSLEEVFKSWSSSAWSLPGRRNHLSSDITRSQAMKLLCIPPFLKLDYQNCIRHHLLSVEARRTGGSQNQGFGSGLTESGLRLTESGSEFISDLILTFLLSILYI